MPACGTKITLNNTHTTLSTIPPPLHPPSLHIPPITHPHHTVEETIIPHLPHCRILLPTAPVRPVERLHGKQVHAWMDSEGHADRFDERCQGLEVC